MSELTTFRDRIMGKTQGKISHVKDNALHYLDFGLTQKKKQFGINTM